MACATIPQRYLPERKKEDEQAFLYSDSWIPNKGLDNTLPATVNCIYKKSFLSDGRHFGKLCDRLS